MKFGCKQKNASPLADLLAFRKVVSFSLCTSVSNLNIWPQTEAHKMLFSWPKSEFQICNHDWHVNTKSNLDINVNQTRPVNKNFSICYLINKASNVFYKT